MSTLGIVEFDMSTGHRQIVATVTGHGKKLLKAANRKLNQFANGDKCTEHTYYISEK